MDLPIVITGVKRWQRVMGDRYRSPPPDAPTPKQGGVQLGSSIHEYTYGASWGRVQNDTSCPRTTHRW